MPKLRIGTRGSQLALWQANYVAGRLRACGHEVEIRVIKTTGDRKADIAFAEVGTKGMFTRELEEALADGEVDLAVHSLKDLPTDLSAAFEIIAIPERADPRDAFVSARFENIFSLPHGARVGTSSLRRGAQLKAWRPDLELEPLRGNVDTRLRKLEAGNYDAMILAFAGLQRLQRTEFVREVIEPEIMCPAAGQGALALESRTGDTSVNDQLRVLDDRNTRLATTCERSLLNAMGGGCQVPIAALAELKGNALFLQAVVAHPAGVPMIRVEMSGSDPERLGEEAARELLDRGGSKILQEVGQGRTPAPQRQ